MLTVSLFLSQLLNGIVLGSLLAMTSVGLTIILGTLGVLNMAHGALFMVGAYVAYATIVHTQSFVLAMLLAPAVVMVLGVIMEQGLIRRFYSRPHEDQILVTFGLSIVLVEAVRMIFGGVAKLIPSPDWGQGIVQIGSLIYPKYRMLSLVIIASILFVLYLVLYRTRIGLIVRAGIEDRLMVSMLGINVNKTFLAVFALGSMSAGFAGVIYSPILALTPGMGEQILVESFVVVVLGGLGSFPGAIIGGIIGGLILSLTAMFNPAYSHVALFAAMALILVLRPQGLLGVEGRQ